MASDTNSNKSGSTLSELGSGISEQASRTASEIQARSADALAKLTDTAQQAGREATHQAKVTAASLASEANKQFTGLLSEQIGAGADLVDQVAEASRGVADNIDKKAPQLAGMIRNAARSAEEFAEGARGRTVTEIVDLTSQYARQQPAIFVGAAVATGFLLARFVKSSAQHASSARESLEDHASSRPRAGVSGDLTADESHDA